MSTSDQGPRKPAPRNQGARPQSTRSGGNRPSSSRSGSGSSRRNAPPPRRRASRFPLELVIAGVVLVALVAVVWAVFFHSSNSTPAVSPTPTGVASAVQSGIPASFTAANPCQPYLTAGVQPLGKNQWGAPPKLIIDKTKKWQVTFTTDKGVIKADMLAQQAPITVNNFLFLACNHYYDGLTFHRIIKNFMIQGGDPKGDGTGGPGYSFQDELPTASYKLGSLAMANAGANTNGSQFFIVQGAEGVGLPLSYSLFGQVTSGQNVVDALASVPVGGPQNSSPLTPVTIKSITVQIL